MSSIADHPLIGTWRIVEADLGVSIKRANGEHGSQVATVPAPA